MANILLITGPTREKIDDVRFISNFSSGKMGLALARAALNDAVEIVSGPVNIEYPNNCSVTFVESASEMLTSAQERAEAADIIICCAAVCDYRPKTKFSGKLKKGADDECLSTLELVPNPDILKELSANKRAEQVIVGFAAESSNLIENAKAKLINKGCDLIVANDVSNSQTFGSDESKIFIITKDEVIEVPKQSKDKNAEEILVHAKSELDNRADFSKSIEFLESLTIKSHSRFDSMSKREIKIERFKSRGLL